jgi:hypothetical protein
LHDLDARGAETALRGFLFSAFGQAAELIQARTRCHQS